MFTTGDWIFFIAYFLGIIAFTAYVAKNSSNWKAPPITFLIGLMVLIVTMWRVSLWNIYC